VTVSTNRLRTKTTQSESASTDFQSIDFDGFFQAHWSRVYGVIYRLVGDHAEAEDLALEVFWRLHQYPPRRIDNHPGLR
jgi:DNA-directed RNA polymerase specialized sigma24 family protein